MNDNRSVNGIRAARTAASMVLVLAAPLVGGFACGGETSGDEPIVVARGALGSTEQPQDINTLAGLRAMTLTGNYRLTADITMQPWDPPFVPIGWYFAPFTGTFNGNDFKINNLRITGNSAHDDWYVGLFGATYNAILTKVALVNVNVSGRSNVGAITGFLEKSELTSSYVTGTVTGTSTGSPAIVGMAVGTGYAFARISRCYATGTVTGRATAIGGFIGAITAYGELTPDSDPRVNVTEVFTNVNVNPTIPATPGEILAGGLVGRAQGAFIEDINVVGNVLGRVYAGGVVGRFVNDDPMSEGSIFRNAISRGIVTVSGTPNRAGTIGFNTGIFSNCAYTFWNNQTDGGSPPPMEDPQCQEGKTTSQLRSPHPAPNKLIDPYHQGMLITQQMINESSGTIGQCELGSGTDGDWGFGTCGTTAVWALNSSTEYITLTRIPNPGVQPK
jgi:hypothetical protein